MSRFANNIHSNTNNILTDTQHKHNETTKMQSNNGTNHNGTRVWIKRTLVDSIRNPKVQRYGRSAAAGSSSSITNTTPSLQTPHQFGGISAAMSMSSSSVSRTKSQNSDDGSEAGSSIVTSSIVGGANTSSLGRSQVWGWLPAILCEQSSAKLVVKLEEDSSLQDKNKTLSVPPSSLEQGDILLDNELPLNAQGQAAPPQDLIKLTHLHEPAVVQSLKLRYEQDTIYTATGPVLLALNPFQNIRGLYGESTMKKYYSTQDKSSLPPHVYQIADASFRSMMRRIDETVDDPDQKGKCNQSILVSGESGAGKTVTTKFVMKYLAALSQRSMKSPAKRAYQRAKEHQSGLQNVPETPAASTPTSAAGSPSWAYTTPNVKPAMLDRKETGLSCATTLSGSSSNSIESKVLQSNPILESFGNARTVRNDNSSRFGKFIEIQFTSSGKLVGATIDTYLLEKVRLVTQSPGERNYHIFYEILEGMPANELRHYFLAKTAGPEDFAMLSSSGVSDRRDGILDKDTYKSLRVAMETMKLSNDEITDIFSVACAILHASNLDFVEAGAQDHEACSLDPDNVHLAPVCHLLGINGEDLNEALCTLHIQAGGGDTVSKSLSKEKAEKGLEALVKTAYGALFQYLVQRINDSIAWKKAQDEEDENENENDATLYRDAPAATIGVLDIFGFESFQTNSFEQLCINYCNEALQQQFNAFVLKNEQEEYEREGIEWSFIEFPENQDVLDLIDKRGQGILNILDDQCRAPGTHDGSFASDVYRKWGSSQRFRANRKQQSRNQFEICHYAGPVEYTAEGFIEKNRDELPKESLELLATSERDFVRVLADILSGTDSSSNNKNVNNSFNTGGPSRLNRADSALSSSGKTVGGQFRRQLKDLRQKIDQTSPHYIRCLKPNDDLVPDHFDTAIVAEQLRCGGILEAVRVSRAGFTQHYPHADFVKRYRMLALGSELSAAATGRTSFGGGISPTSLMGRGGGRPSFGSSNKTNTVTPKSNYSGKRWGVPSQSGGKSGSSSGLEISSGGKSKSATSNTDGGINSKDQCKDLLKVLSKRIREFEKDDMKENVPEDGAAGGDGSKGGTPSTVESKPAAAKAKSYSLKQSSPTPAWANRISKNNSNTATVGAGFSSPLPPTTPSTSNKPSKIKTSYQPWNANNSKSITPSASTPTESGTPQSPSYRAASYRRGFSGSDAAKLGIQVGKTKVFLRHRAFEVLERLRSRQQTSSATKLNAVFRMHLCRSAYLPIRDAFRRERRIHTGDDSFAKETKEDEMMVERSATPKSNIAVSKRWQHSGNFAKAMVESYESQVRASIHNPIPRHEWGQAKEESMASFKWMLVEGLWVKNPVFREGDDVKEEISI